MGVGDVSKRILLGRKLRSSQLGESLLRKRVALPIFAGDALSSVAYAPDEIFIMLSLAGASAYAWSWKVGLAVAVVMLVVVTSYRQTVHAYPGGGGDYEVASANLGRTAGVTVASALLVDYVLTVAVSISAGAHYASSALSFLDGHEVLFASLMVALLAALNLRGVRESAAWFALPTYLFIVAVLGMCGYGLLRWSRGRPARRWRAPPSRSPPRPASRARSPPSPCCSCWPARSPPGCAALTGVEAVSNGVPAFRRPKSRNAATTLLLLGLISVSMMMSIIVLARQMGLKYVDPLELQRLTTPTARRSPATTSTR